MKRVTDERLQQLDADFTMTTSEDSIPLVREVIESRKAARIHVRKNPETGLAESWVSYHDHQREVEELKRQLAERTQALEDTYARYGAEIHRRQVMELSLDAACQGKAAEYRKDLIAAAEEKLKA